MAAEHRWLFTCLLALHCFTPAIHASSEPLDPEAWQQLIQADWLASEQLLAESKPTSEITTADDAAGGCDGSEGDWGFHTGKAQEPWWQVDLGTPKPLSRVIIWNRSDAAGAADRARHLQLRLSHQTDPWRTVYEHDGTPFGLTNREPLVIHLTNETARFVRLQLPENQYLHLDEVEVFGPADPTENLALNRPADQVSISQWSRPHPKPVTIDWASRTRETIAYCRKLASELQQQDVAASQAVDALARLSRLLAKPSADHMGQAQYLLARQTQRQLALANSILGFDEILFTKRVPASFNHMSDQYYGWWAQPGGGLYILRHFKEGIPETTCITESFSAPGSFLRPTLSYDAEKVLFAWCRYYPELAGEPNKLDKSNVPEDAFYHLFEMNLDGSGLRRLTHGKYDDFDGRYLPDGRILFLSTRRGQCVQAGRQSAQKTVVHPALPDCYVRCGGGPERPVAVYTLHTMRPDGSELCAISPFEMFEWTPEVANDGTILYSRWDYIDRHNMPYMGLWAINPDGTQPRIVYGNFTKSPHCVFEPKCVPHSPKILFTASAHHAQTMGSLVLLDPHVGTEGAAPLTRLTPEVPFPEIEGWPRTYYTSPWPLSERFHLVAWGYEGKTVPGPSGWDRWHAVRRPKNGMGLYFFDASGTRDLLYKDPEISCFDPIPIRPRPVPPTLARHTDWAKPLDGEFLLLDVYQGLEKVARGQIKSLRIVAVPPKTHPTMNYPSLGLTADDPGKCVLGTVPVEEDGSAYFRAPAGVTLFFQALDPRGFALQTMRSATHLQPGQRLSCVGCHEPREQTPTSSYPLAAARPVSRISVGPEGSWPLRFDRLVQPVLDQHCVSCHHPNSEDPQAAQFDLTSTNAYSSLVNYGPVSLRRLVTAGYHQGYSRPGSGPASQSSLLALLIKPPGHYDLELDTESLERLVLWMDTYAQKAGAFSQEQEQQLQQLRSTWSDLLISTPSKRSPRWIANGD